MYWCTCPSFGWLCDAVELLAPEEPYAGVSARRHLPMRKLERQKSKFQLHVWLLSLWVRLIKFRRSQFYPARQDSTTGGLYSTGMCIILLQALQFDIKP